MNGNLIKYAFKGECKDSQIYWLVKGIWQVITLKLKFIRADKWEIVNIICCFYYYCPSFYRGVLK